MVRQALWVMCVVWLAAGSFVAADPSIRLSNYVDGEVVRHPVPLLRGELADPAATGITIVNTSSTRDTREMRGLVHKAQFKVLTELVPGENRLILRTDGGELPLTLTYRPQTNRHIVRCIYHTDSTGETAYQTPIADHPQDYARKLDTAMKLMQTFTAERLHDLGFGRKTFNLELDEAGRVKVHVVKAASPAQAYYDLKGVEWWGRVNKELNGQFPGNHAKNFVVAAYTRFDPATRTVRGHTALGGGSLALFGSGNFFTWPSSIADAQKAFLDDRRIDSGQVFDDSAGRGTYWGAASTTIGASLHELGHTFGLPHTTDPLDIMTRGFDRFNRAFTFYDPPSARRPRVDFTEQQVACFPPISAASLVASRWLALDDRRWIDRSSIAITLDEPAGTVKITSDRPIAFVGIHAGGNAIHHIAPAPGVRDASVPLKDIRGLGDADRINVQVINDQGVTACQAIVLHARSPATHPAR